MTRVIGRQLRVRTVDDVVARVFSLSSSAPHLFGDRLADFEQDLRARLTAASDAGFFSEQTPDLSLVLYRRPDVLLDGRALVSTAAVRRPCGRRDNASLARGPQPIRTGTGESEWPPLILTSIRQPTRMSR